MNRPSTQQPGAEPQHQLPHLTEPAHWGVFFTRHLVLVLLAIVALLGFGMWLAASNTLIEQRHSATLIEQKPCSPGQPTVAELLCLRLSIPRALATGADGSWQYGTVQLRVEFENPATYTRTSRDTWAEPLDEYREAPRAQAVDQVIYQASLARPAAQPQIKQLLVISNTTSAWSIFCAWFSARLPHWQ